MFRNQKFSTFAEYDAFLTCLLFIFKLVFYVLTIGVFTIKIIKNLHDRILPLKTQTC